MALPSKPKTDPRPKAVTVRLSEKVVEQLHSLAKEHNLCDVYPRVPLLHFAVFCFPQKKLETCAEVWGSHLFCLGVFQLSTLDHGPGLRRLSDAAPRKADASAGSESDGLRN